MEKSCLCCGSEDLRLSRVRRSDLLRLLTLRLPIRCRICRQRDFAFVGAALALRKRGMRREPTHA